MKKTVKKLRIDGDRLNDIFLISDENYYGYYHILKMDVEYDYEEGANKGTCKVCFYFSAPRKLGDKDNDAALVFSCVKITHDNKVNEISKKIISKKISSFLANMIDNKFKEIVSERVVVEE